MGVKFTRDVVDNHNSIFQEVSLENDIGNDAYIEFVKDEEATGCCIFVQIKSGDSYVKPNGNYIFKADKDHFEYWVSHSLPIGCIVYSPKNNQAVWYDVTEYLSQNPTVIESGPYTINIPASQKFCDETFNEFVDHFLKYLEPYKHKLGVALQKFSDRNNHRICLDGMKYLFTFQRQNFVSWYYIITCYRNFRKHPILFQLTNMIAYLPGHEDIFWHKQNIIQEQTRKAALEFLNERFGRDEVLTMLEIVTDGGGFTRGAIGQSVYAIVRHVKNREAVLESILSDLDVDEHSRYWSLLLLIYFTQLTEKRVGKCIELISKYQHLFSDDETRLMVQGIREEIETRGNFHLFF